MSEIVKFRDQTPERLASEVESAIGLLRADGYSGCVALIEFLASNTARAVEAEREATAKWHEARAEKLRWPAARYFRFGERENGRETEAELHTHRISAIDIRNGEHMKGA